MKSISVKVNDSVQTIAEAKVITKDGQPTIIKANRNANYELINDATGRGPDHIVTKRVGKDLHVSFEENAEESDLIIENFYDYDKSALIGQAESGQYHYYVPDTGLTQDYVTELVIGDIEGQALGGQGYPAPWWIGAEEGSRFGIMPWLVGIAGIAAVGALAGDDNDNTKAPVADTQTPTPQPKPLPVELKIGPSQNPTDAKLSIVLSEGAEKISINLPGLTPIETTVDALKALDTNPASNTYDISINQLVSPGLGNYSLSLVDYQKVIDNIKNGQAVEVTAKKEGFTDGKADDAVTQTPDVDTVNKDGDNFATINPKPNTTNASEVTVSYTPSSGNANPQTITATKVGDQWQATTGNTSITTADTTKAPTDKPSIDPVTGVISIPTSLVNTSQYTPVTAQVTKTTDNKPSLQNNVDLPDTPSVNIPTINSGETDYPITVTPGNDNTSIVTSYTDEAGKPQTITVTKNPDGSYSATQDGKPVKTTPTDGNTPWVNDKNGTLTLPKDSVDNNKPVTTVGKTDNGSAQDATNPANTPKVVANKPTVTQTGLPQQADIVATPGEGNTKTSTTYTDEQGNTKTITATYDPATNTWTAKNPNDPTKDLPTAPTADGKTPYVDSTTGAITFPPASVDNTKPVTMVGEKEGSTPTIATASPAQSPDVAVKPPVTGQKDGDIVATPGDGNTQTQTTYTPEGSNKPITITATRYTNNDGVPDTWVAKNPNDPTKDLPTTNTDGKTPYIDPKTGAITFPPASVDNAKPVAMVGEKEGSIPSVDTIDLTDKAAPIIENIKVDVAVNGAGDKIVLTYDEPLDVNNPPPATSFTVTVDGKKVIPTVEVSGNAVILNVPTPILKDQEVKVAYNKPADTKDNKAIQDQAGNDADSLTSTPAKNNSTMVDTDKDGIPDSQDDDDDNDGVTDADEKLVGTDPTNPTSDGNTPDGKLDSDGDGISNDDESVTKAEDPTATNTDKPTDKDGDGKPDIATAKVPTKPATAPDMTDATDTGVSNSDNITTNKTPSFSVPKPTDGEPVLVINGKVVESTSTPDPKNPNNVILTPKQPLSEGVSQIATATKKSSQVSDPSEPVVVTVDTTAPTGTTATLDPASDTGVKGDNITSDTTPTIKGKGNAGDTVIVTFPAQDGGKPEVVKVKVDEKGEWSATPTKELKDGANTISVSVKDPAGNVGVVNPAVITINTTKPTATATLDPNSDSGDKGDGITNNTMPKITGKGKEGDTIKVTFPSKDGTPEEKTVTVGKGGTWEVVPTKALKEGENQIGVEVTDKTTGTKTDLPVVKVTVDTTAPTGTTATLDPASDTGVKGDNITSDTTPTIKGKGNAGDTVIVTFPAQDGGKPEVVKVKVDEKGEWSATPTKELKDGANTISVSVKDPAGNVGVVNPATVSVNVDTTAPTAPTPVANSDGSVTADLPKDPQDGDTVTISYTPEQGANKTATLKYDGATKTWKPDPANGDVQVVDGKATLPADKVKDNSLVKVSAADKAGNESPAMPATTVSAKAPASAGVQNDGVVDNTGKTAVDEGQTISTKVTLTNANGNPALKLEYTGTADAADIGTPTFKDYDETKGKITYDSVNGTINVPKGVDSFTIDTPINADGKTETAENIKVKVGGVDANQLITINDTSKGAATIDNSANDGVKTKPASEGGNLVTTVKLVAGAQTELAIKRTGTASNDDFDAPKFSDGVKLSTDGTKLTVPAGVTEFTITTPVKTDNLSEGNETVKYTVGGVDGNEATITDTTPALAVQSITNANAATTVAEGQSIQTTVTLNRASDKQTELDYNQNLAGANADDFDKVEFNNGVKLSQDGTKLIVPVGVTEFTITTTVKADNATEAAAESFNYTVGGETSGTVTINDTSKKPAPTQISSLIINDDDGTGSEVGIDGQYTGNISNGAVTNDTTPTLTITLNQALQTNETLQLVRYIKDPVTNNLTIDRVLDKSGLKKNATDDKVYTLEDDLQSVTTAGTDYVYKARVFDSNTKEEFAEKTESMRLDTVAEQAVVTSYDPKTHILKGVSKEIGGTIFVSKDGNGKYSSAPKAVVAENGEWTMQLEGNDIPKDQNSVNNIYWSRRDKNDIPVAISMIDKAGNQPKSIISDLYAFYNNEYADGSGREGSFSAADTPISSTGKQMPSGAGNERRGDIDNNKTKNYLTSWDDSDVDNQTIYARQITTYDTKQRNAFDVSMGKGDDALYVAGDVTSNIRIDMGDGNDYLYTGGEFGTGHGGVNTILHMGAGNDTVKIEKNSYITTMTLGDGNDDLRMGGQLGNYSTIDAGNGNDHVHISGHKNNIAVNAHSKIDMGDGNDTLVIGYNISTDSTINLGAGNDAFHYGYGRLDGKVDGGEGTDVLRVFNTANQNVVISSDNITNFERVDITGEKHYVNTFRATDKLFVNNNFAEHGVNKDMLLDGDTANSKLELLDSSFWNKVSTSLADANGNAVAKKAEDMFTLDDGRTVKGTVVNGDTKYYYTNQEGDITGERYEGNIYNVYTTTSDAHNRLLVDLDVQVIL
ncbi:hypothetical protein IM753_09185 [Moraxella sp. K127]|uniref:Ig-like domain-containing protein n=1 Tax=Moraxella sp. K127 TaxID=2780079 RepID=UPI001881E434|nr:Ig-like domain-containing protein [Moraxella sp. K127]MBE9591140.1 hypothetical protein [Moraxella sp. K127]